MAFPAKALARGAWAQDLPAVVVCEGVFVVEHDDDTEEDGVVVCKGGGLLLVV